MTDEIINGKSLNKYTVSIPFTGYVTVEVEAENKNAAIKAAFEQDIDLQNDLGEIEYHTIICNGNVFYGLLNEIEVEEAIAAAKGEVNEL